MPRKRCLTCLHGYTWQDGEDGKTQRLDCKHPSPGAAVDEDHCESWVERKRDADADLAMCEAATPEPWEWVESRYHAERVGIDGPNGPVLRGTAVADGASLFEEYPSEADEHFMAEARTALPHYIKRTQAVEAKLLRLQTWLNERIDNWRHSAACYRRDGDPEEALSCEADAELLQMVLDELKWDPEEATPDA